MATVEVLSVTAALMVLCVAFYVLLVRAMCRRFDREARRR